jgi:hypothetical protein
MVDCIGQMTEQLQERNKTNDPNQIDGVHTLCPSVLIPCSFQQRGASGVASLS